MRVVARQIACRQPDARSGSAEESALQICRVQLTRLKYPSYSKLSSMLMIRLRGALLLGSLLVAGPWIIPGEITRHHTGREFVVDALIR
jgi:hypothetical protein